jgi:hypothetical protein
MPTPKKWKAAKKNKRAPCKKLDGKHPSGFLFSAVPFFVGKGTSMVILGEFHIVSQA